MGGFAKKYEFPCYVTKYVAYMNSPVILLPFFNELFISTNCCILYKNSCIFIFYFILLQGTVPMPPRMPGAGPPPPPMPVL